jgi:hypothetical protein
LAQRSEQSQQLGLKRVQAAGLVDHLHAVVALHVRAGRVEVAVEVAGRQKGGSEYFGITYLAVNIVFSANGKKEIIDKAVYCNVLSWLLRIKSANFKTYNNHWQNRFSCVKPRVISRNLS